MDAVFVPLASDSEAAASQTTNEQPEAETPAAEQSAAPAEPQQD